MKKTRTNPHDIPGFQRIFALYEEKKLWKEAIRIATEEGYRNAMGEPFKLNTAKAYYNRKDQRAEILGTETTQKEQSNVNVDNSVTEEEPESQGVVDTVDNNDIEDSALLNNTVDNYEKEYQDEIMNAVKAMITELEARLTQLTEERIQAAMTNISKVDIVDSEEQLPVALKTGKKLHGSKEHIHARIDSNLFRIFDEKVKAHYNGNASRCLDAVLWRAFGKPKLSFEEPEIDNTAMEPEIENETDVDTSDENPVARPEKATRHRPRHRGK